MSDSILVFDSGVGGLSILSELRQQLPSAHIEYLMDSELFPYGNRDDELLAERIISLCCQAVEQLSPNCLILACNTASTLALNLLREQLTIPVVGVVPAIKVAAEACQKAQIKTFGLLATRATVQREYTQKLIDEFANNYQVIRYGSQPLVSMAEEFIAGRLNMHELYEHLNPWLKAHPQMQHIVLGCTHFPLLREQLEELWPNKTWIDSGRAVAKQCARVFSGNQGSLPKLSLYWTGSKCSGVTQYMLPYGNLVQQEKLTLST